MEKFEKNDEEKLRAESIMEDVTHLRNSELEDKAGNIFRVTQRIADIYKDSKNSEKELKIAGKAENIEKRNEIIEELKERKKEFEVFAKDKNRLDESLRTIEEIDKMIVKFETENEIDEIEYEGLINKISSNKTKPEENIWKN